MDILAKQDRGGNVQPLFISLDPWRDSVANMRVYTQEFHPRLIGLTGTPEQVKAVAKEFRVYSTKAPGETEDDYLVDHSIIMYLLDEHGKFVTYFGKDKTAEQIAAKIVEVDP